MKSPVDLYLAAKKAEFLLLTFQIQSDYDSLNGSTSNGSSNSSDSNSDTVNEDEGSSTLNPMAKIVATDKEHENGPITTAIDNSKRKLSVASTDSSPTKKPRHLQNTRESVIEQYSMALEAFKKQELQSSELCHLLYDYGSFVENPDLFDQAYEIISNLEKQEDDYLLMGKILLQQAYYKLDNNGMFNDSIVIEAIDMFKKAGNDESSKITIARQLLDHALLKKSKLQG